MEGCVIDVQERIVDSLIGSNYKIMSNDSIVLKGRRFILG
jgi:hypothetical protein